LSRGKIRKIETILKNIESKAIFLVFLADNGFIPDFWSLHLGTATSLHDLN
jgi:hypothetical protein